MEGGTNLSSAAENAGTRLKYLYTMLSFVFEAHVLCEILLMTMTKM